MKPEIEVVGLTRFYGGGEVYLARLARLLANDVSMTVVSPDISPLRSQVLAAGARFESLPARSRWNVIASMFSRLASKRKDAAARPACVLLSGRSAAYWAPMYRRRGLAPVVIRHTEIRRDLAEHLYVGACRKGVRVVAVSQTIAEQHRPLGIANVVAIPNWLDTSTRASHCHSINAGALSPLIFVGRLEQKKGLAELFAAVRNSGDLTLDILGDGPLREDGLPPRDPQLRFHGFVADIKPFLQRARLFVQPSYSESFSYAAAEALLAGLICVLSDIPAHRELVPSNYPTELFFVPGDARDLDRSIRTALRWSQEQPALLEKAWRDAVDRICLLNGPDSARRAYLEVIEQASSEVANAG
jgi:glycosyltransferase involved in cell wall biosynthesis